MMSETVVIREPLCSDQRMSWTAIFVGALVGAGLGFLLNLFGIAIGLSILTQKDGAAALAVGGLLGFLIAVITSMVVAGYTAGYLGRTYCPKRNLGVLYGFTTWGVALILTAAVASHINHYVVGAINILERGHRLLACGELAQLGLSTKQEPIEVTQAEVA